jgi:hypothetical protein
MRLRGAVLGQRATASRPRGQAGNLVNNVLLSNLSPPRRRLEEQKRTISGWYQLFLEEAMAQAGLERSSRCSSQHWDLLGCVSTCLFSSGLFKARKAKTVSVRDPPGLKGCRMPGEVIFPLLAPSFQAGLGEPSIPDSWAPTLLGSQTHGLRRNWVVSSTRIPLRVLWSGVQHPELPSGKPLTTESVHLEGWSEGTDITVHRSVSAHVHIGVSLTRNGVLLTVAWSGKVSPRQALGLC